MLASDSLTGGEATNIQTLRKANGLAQRCHKIFIIPLVRDFSSANDSHRQETFITTEILEVSILNETGNHNFCSNIYLHAIGSCSNATNHR